MEDRLKELMQELGNAINESLSDSDRIAAAIGEIKRAGYDVFLVLEAPSDSTNARTPKMARKARPSSSAPARRTDSP